ncbi:restriction endonuclease subunit S [Pseudoalteromonas prydzensis]|uniref:restriction endonuclease subunit S n=1 Tax=Pseudoalteromonas prydzensis TaxID=182141 RepID=UPI0024BBEE48|nr:restriction endonuclease subunit S [Pseudoalteromonas prydzensis]
MSQAESQLTPEDWSNTTIGDFAPLQRGFDLPNRDRIDGNYPVVYSNGVMNFHNTYQVKGPGVVTGRSGTIGKVHFVNEDYWPHNTALWVKQFINAVPKYVYYLYTYIGFDRFSSGSGVPTLNRNDAHSFAITVPTEKEEQTAIANALSDVDALLTELENLIAKKQAIKIATMQQLLTGKTRLPQFATYTEGEKQGVPEGKCKGTKPSELGEIPEDWEVRDLPEVVWYQEGPGLRNWQFTNKGLKVINVTNLQESGFLNLDKTDRHITWEEYEKMYKHFSCDVDDLVIASSGNSYCKSSIVRQADLPLLMNTSVIRFKAKQGIDRLYMTVYLRSKFFKDQIDLMITGGAQPNFGPFHLNKVLIPLPTSKEEQTAIATILSDMDNEIQTLEQRLTKTRQIKQGMMQQLLTGRTRLPFKQAEEA